MEESRSSTPEPPQDLWSSILDSVSSSRSTPTKQVIILGEPSTGKSTIAAALLGRKVEDEDSERRDFAIGYEYADVKEEGDEDTIMRVSVYTVPSSHKTYMSLLPHFLPPRSTLPNSAVVILLDWTRPWSFLEQLQTWLQWVERWAQGDGSRELEVVREENRERLQSHWQHYTEPSSEALPSSSTLNGTVLPLGPGTLMHNSSGVPIIVVCTKADLIDETTANGGTAGMGGMVKGKGSEWEERTDSIMQVLRVICLKYGASLFYTTPTPQTMSHLRQLVFHMLFVPPAPSPGLSSTEVVAPHRNPFQFVEKPNILDRDRILVPSGWDSWGKIAVLRDGFDAKSWSEAWDKDVEGDGGTGAKLMYAELVPDRGVKPTPLPPFNEPIPEQAFLAKNYDENSKKPDRDPRGAFRNPSETVAGTGAGIVGPMGSSSFSLPNVERALVEMEGGIGLGSSVGGDARKPRRDMPGRTTGPLSASTRPPLATSPLASSPSPTSSQNQHDVLQKFFDKLLSSSTNRDRGAAAGASTNASARPTVERPSSSNSQPALHEGVNGSSSDVNGTASGAE